MRASDLLRKVEADPEVMDGFEPSTRAALSRAIAALEIEESPTEDVPMPIKFSEEDIKFLLEKHEIEVVPGKTRELREAYDIRTLGCPAHIFERVLADRADRLGDKFREFRARQAARD
jgi:hypothetical protein